jgi:predicted neutral ceramidase superfamily lipid hydrolase
MQTNYRCKRCGAEGGADYFSEHSDLCNACANANVSLRTQSEPKHIEPEYPPFLSKILLTVYAFVCLFTQIKVAIRWSGNWASGILCAVVSFGFPTITALIVSDALAKKSNNKRDHYFTPILFTLIVLSSILLLLFYSIMSSVSY